MVYDEALAARVRGLLAIHPRIDERRMFGGLTFMLDGQMCCGVLKDDLVVRVGTEQEDAALREPHARRMDFTGKPMPGMLYVAPAGVATDQQLGNWVDRAVRYVRTHPRTAAPRSRR